MPTNFPGAVDVFPSADSLNGDNLDGSAYTGPPLTPFHSVLHGNLGLSVIAVETYILATLPALYDALGAAAAAQAAAIAHFTAGAGITITSGVIAATGGGGGGTYSADESTLHLSVSNVFSIISTYAGQASIVTLGSVTTGIWNATKIAALYGGTGIDSSAGNGLAYVSGGTWSITTTPALGTPSSGSLVNCTGYLGTSSLVTTGTLTSGATGAGFTVALGTSTITGILATAHGGTGIAFFTAAGPSVARVYTFPDAACNILTDNALVTVAQGGTGLGTLTAHALYVGAGTSVPAALAVGATNTLLHGNTGANPSYSAVVEADLSLTDVTTANVSTTAHGFAPKAPNDATKYLDGTGAYSVPVGSGSGDALANFVNAANALTNPSGSTLTANTWNVINATSACNAKLPAPSAGHVIGVRIKTSSTALFTLNPNSSENIGPGTNSSRIMWAGESAILVSDGTDWIKVAGLTIPMLCRLYLQNSTNNQTLASGSVITITLDTVGVDNTGLMADTANHQIKIKRGGNYNVAVLGTFTGGATGQGSTNFNGSGRALAQSLDGATTITQTEVYANSGEPSVGSIAVFNCASDDNITMTMFQGSGLTNYAQYGTGNTWLLAEEVPSW